MADATQRVAPRSGGAGVPGGPGGPGGPSRPKGRGRRQGTDGRGRAGGRGGHGFSSVELLCAVVLLGLLAGLALPAVGPPPPRLAVAGARDAFAMLHGRARAEAVSSGRVARLRIDPQQARAVLTLDPEEAGGFEGSEGGQLGLAQAARPPDAAVDFSARFSGVSLESNRRTLCFGPRGLATAGSGCDLPNATVVFRLRDAADTVTISVAGRLLKR